MTSRRIARAGLLAVVLALAAGCSATPKAGAMRVESTGAARTQPFTVSVHVSGGQAFDFRVSDAEFEKALVDSLRRSGVFEDVVAPEAADLRLDVVLGDDRGLEGRELGVLWSLSRSDTQETLWQELVESKGHSSHFVGVVRTRRSVELAAQENIRKGIERLARSRLHSSSPP